MFHRNTDNGDGVEKSGGSVSVDNVKVNDVALIHRDSPSLKNSDDLTMENVKCESATLDNTAEGDTTSSNHEALLGARIDRHSSNDNGKNISAPIMMENTELPFIAKNDTVVDEKEKNEIVVKETPQSISEEELPPVDINRTKNKSVVPFHAGLPVDQRTTAITGGEKKKRKNKLTKKKSESEISKPKKKKKKIEEKTVDVVYEVNENIFTLDPKSASQSGRSSLSGEYVVRHTLDYFAEENLNDKLKKADFETFQPTVEYVQERATSKGAQRKKLREEKLETRRQELGNKRKEKEFLKLKALEEQKRKKGMLVELEEEDRKRKEEVERKEREEGERQRKVEIEQQILEQAEEIRHLREMEKEKKAKDRMTLLAAQRQADLEFKRDQERLAAKIEEDLLRKEQELLSKMNAKEREVYMQQKQLEEERKKLAEEERQRKLLMKKMEEEEDLMSQLKELEILYMKTLSEHFFEAGMKRTNDLLTMSQQLSRAYTYSYYHLLPSILYRASIIVKNRIGDLPSLSDLLKSMGEETDE